MYLNEVLQFIDESLEAKTGKHLNDLQRRVLEGILNRQKYSDIADEYGRTEGHIKDTGCELLQMLSEIFGEQVNKGNLKSVLERHSVFNLSFGDQGHQGNIHSNLIGCINFGNEPLKKTENGTSLSLDLQTIMKIKKLKQRGFHDEEIAEILDLDLSHIQKISKSSQYPDESEP